MIIVRLIVVAVLCITGACVPSPRFEWGAYEIALYRYHKQPTEREAYRTALRVAIDRGIRTNRLAPGLLAELGYLSLEDGDTVTAITLFEQEKTSFPESAPLMERIVEQLRNPAHETPSATSAEVQS